MPISGHRFSDLVFPEQRKVYLDVAYTRKPETWALIAGATCLRQTDKALLIRVPAMPELEKRLGHGDKEFWIPKSQLHSTENEVSKVGDMGFLVIPEWLAKEKRLL
jgi:hypothetical protein